LDTIGNLFSQYLIPFLALPLIGTIIGSWLSQLYFPFEKKKREWHWEKQVHSKELFYESVTHVSLLSNSYLKSQHDVKFSMLGFGLEKTNQEIVDAVRALHVNAHKISIYLDSSDRKLFAQYLQASQDAFDDAKESWEQWNDDENVDYMEIAHTENTIHAQGKAADDIVEKINRNS